MEGVLFILDHRGFPTEVQSLKEVVEWRKQHSPFIQQTFFAEGTLVSTAFLNVNQRMGQQGPPIVFETIIFSDNFPEIHGQRRSACSLMEALEHHETIIKMLETVMPVHTTILEHSPAR